MSKVPPEGEVRSFEVFRPAESGIDLAVPLEGPITANFEIRRMGNELHVAGSVRATLRLMCSRCLAPFSFPVVGTVDAAFGPPAQVLDGEHQHELAEDELEVEPLVGGAADLRAVIAEQIHLGLPLKPLCREDCPGICPHCGRPGGLADCGCTPEAGDPRWEALKKLTNP